MHDNYFIIHKNPQQIEVTEFGLYYVKHEYSYAVYVTVKPL